MTEEHSREDLAGAGPALFHVVRFWSRRWMMRAADETIGDQKRIHDIAVLDAVDSAARGSVEVSIADVAHQLGLDHSGASRFVTAAIERGYLHRGTSATDNRRAVLTVTVAGRQVLTNSHAWQEDVYARLVQAWDAADATRFADYLRRLAADLTDPTARAGRFAQDPPGTRQGGGS
ncbi:MarR family winged helix-turn-helix transcriptional regulator [Tsukamurella soli]|uniref:MarR family winged helix-turn-helix transcriptional regulator n=1 Tax=Tsukamurella soli TaxID=644556 RepID=A0ABP8J532_9ACTN